MSLQTRPVTLPELAALEEMFLFKPQSAGHLDKLNDLLTVMDPLGEGAKLPEETDPLAPRDRFLLLALNADEQACLENAIDVYDKDYKPALAEFCRLAIINQAATIHRLGAVMHVGAGFHSSDYYDTDRRVGVVPAEARGGQRAAALANKCRIGQSKSYETIDRNDTSGGRPVSYFVALGAELGELDEDQLTSVLLPFLPILRNIVAKQDKRIQGREPGEVVSMETIPDSPDATEARLLAMMRELGPDYLAQAALQAEWTLGRVRDANEEAGGDDDTDTEEAAAAETAGAA